MMKSKYNIQVCWYVHSDQSSRSLRVGHIRSIHPLDKVVWFGYAFMARLLIYFLLRKLCIPYFSNVTREVSGEINFLLYTRYGSKSMSRKKRDLEPRLRPQRLICTIIFLIFFFLYSFTGYYMYIYTRITTVSTKVVGTLQPNAVFLLSGPSPRPPNVPFC